MLNRHEGMHADVAVANRKALCQKNGMLYENVVYQRISYNDTQTYDVLKEVTSAHTTSSVQEVAADALFTSERDVGMLLPVADCIATIIYDPSRHCVAMLHLGRHSSLTSLIAKTIELFIAKGSDPHDLIVWMSPNIQQSHYRMDYFDKADNDEWREFCEIRDGGCYVDLQGHNRAMFIANGVTPKNIYVSGVDTAEHAQYFSHFKGDTASRFAVLVVLV